MDDTDLKLVSLLRDNSRTPVAALAKKLGVARGTVQNRLRKLEADGAIVGYTVRLKSHQEEGIRAVMTVEVEGDKARAVLSALRSDPNVAAVHSTNGRWDFVLEVQAETIEAFDTVLSRIRLIHGIANSESSILLATHKV